MSAGDVDWFHMTDLASHTKRPVLFDLDGTLADTIPLLLSSMRAAYAAVGGAVPEERAWLRGMGTPLRAQFMHFESNKLERVEPLITAYREWQIANLAALVREYDGVRALVETLRAAGHPIGVVTGKGDWMARITLEHVGLLGWRLTAHCISATRRMTCSLPGPRGCWMSGPHGGRFTSRRSRLSRRPTPCTPLRMCLGC
jgi:phosphoglycolate phosphatase-like HAD superfamily hydrolase